MTTDALMNTFGERSTTLVRGSGCYVWDANGNKYLDALSGVAVCGLGHAHPDVTRAICKQTETLLHCSNLFNIDKQEQLAERLRELSGMENMFFCNSGAEANEAAIKLARLYGHSKGIDLPTIIVMSNSFHGRTLATLTATGSRKVQAGFEPLVRGFVRAPYDDVEAVRRIAANNKDVCAILVEPIQGEGGVVVPDRQYLSDLRSLCDQNKWLLMLDEIQTSNGRTGTWFNYQQHNLLPDVVTTAKGLGNGVPVGACLARGIASQLMKPGSHGSTFGGNPLACAAALATLQVIERDKLCTRAAELGARLKAEFTHRLRDVAQVKAVRGAGMMLGIELSSPCKSLFETALQNGLVINVTADSVIRLLPPLVMTDAEAEELVTKLVPLIKNFNGN